MSEDLMVMIESLVQEHYGTQGLEYLRQRTRPTPAVHVSLASQSVPDGYALVPVEPTDAMCDAADKAEMRHFMDDQRRGGNDPDLSTRAIYRTMVMEYMGIGK